MKKKFLSLMMAAAVVATTSVSAFAAIEEGNKNVTMPKSANVTGKDNQTHSQEVEIIGHVQNDNGEMPTASFNVTVPTAANFTVDNKGTLIAPDLTITNEGTQGVDIFAYKFSKKTGNAMKVVAESEVTNGEGAGVPRTTVSLQLEVGGDPIAYLAANGEKTGVYSDETLEKAAITEDTQDGVKLLHLEAGSEGIQTKKIKLAGKAGKQKNQLREAVSDTFELILKIKKASNAAE